MLSNDKGWGPGNSGDYPFVMLILTSMVTLAFLGSIIPVVEMAFNWAIPIVIVGGVLYFLVDWVWEEYKLNREINSEIEVDK